MTYTAKVVKSGHLRFTYHYQIPNDLSSSLLFTFHYRLYDDNSILSEAENSNIKFPTTTVEQNFETVEIPLKTVGLYIFTWKSVLIGNYRSFFSLRNAGPRYGQFATDLNINKDDADTDHNQTNLFKNNLPSSGMIRIKRIVIEGVAYASECTKCEPGTYASDSGMRECLACPSNSAYAGFGATKCLQCDVLNEYSSRGSTHCRKRPICGKSDYYSIPKEKCNLVTKKQLVEFKWIEPRICVDTNSVFPSRVEYSNCSEFKNYSNEECDLGMELKRDGASEFCQFCEQSHYRDEKLHSCQPCPPFTSPYYALSVFLWNNTLPAWSTAHELPNSIALNEDYFADNPAYLNSYFSRQCIRADEDTNFDSNISSSDFKDDKQNEDALKSDECSSKVAWQPFHNYIRTGASAILDSYLVLSITIPGFRSNSGGEISFVFETICEEGDKCMFMFVETKSDESDLQLQELSGKDVTDYQNSKKKAPSFTQQMNTVIKEWSQSTDGRLSFRYKIDTNISVTYSWVFKRTTSFQSFAKIHSLLVTNSLIGAAIKCKSCPILTKFSSDCISCPDGNYLDLPDLDQNENEVLTPLLQSIESSKINCKRCPPNHILNTSVALPIGIKSCLSCGANLITDNETNLCYSDCLVRFDSDTYDMHELQQPLLYRGVNLFTAGGTQYLHLFKITLCGHKKHASLSTCLNNITAFAEESVSSGVRSFICRSTVIPDGSHAFATQSVNLGILCCFILLFHLSFLVGDELIGITRESTFQNISVHQDFVNSKSKDSKSQDFYLYFLTKTVTNVCLRGRTLTVTMRCSPEVEKTNPGNALVSTPKSCPDGTCDGCNFHLLIETGTAAACRLCRPYSDDYETVVGECVDGFQQVHYINPKGCVIKHLHNSSGAKLNNIQTRPCSVLLPKQIQVGIALFTAIGLLLLLLVFYFWNKNRSLEYKYTKLIESSGEGKGCDDMTLDNCCVENDEEEDDNHLTNSSHNLMFGNDSHCPQIKNSKWKSNNNRLEKFSPKLGSSREMQQLFGKATTSNSRSHPVNDEGYETIHLTSANSSEQIA